MVAVKGSVTTLSRSDSFGVRRYGSVENVKFGSSGTATMTPKNSVCFLPGKIGTSFFSTAGLGSSRVLELRS